MNKARRSWLSNHIMRGPQQASKTGGKTSCAFIASEARLQRVPAVSETIRRYVARKTSAFFAAAITARASDHRHDSMRPRGERHLAYTIAVTTLTLALFHLPSGDALRGDPMTRVTDLPNSGASAFTSSRSRPVTVMMRLVPRR